jgi:RNA polymerase sigma factor (sigma-70 family)
VPPDSPPDPSPHIDPAGWEKLVREARPDAILVVLRNAMSKKLREHFSPEDIWQETLTHAWRDRAQYRWEGPAAFRAWLFEIAHNRIHDAARSLATQKRGAGRGAARFSELVSSSSGSPSGLLPGDSQTPSRIVARGEKGAVLRKALSELPPDLELIVRMHFLDGLTMEAIAKRLDIGVSAAWHRFRKGSEMLARILPSWTGDASGGGS